MHLDVADLRRFYYETNLGRAAQRAVRGRVVESWPEARGLTVAGYGFAAPLLRPFLGSARRVVALMPGPQGVTRWPRDLSNVAVLVEEARWPLETGHVDRLVMMHGLETSEDPGGVLEEAARVLGPGGRMLVIVPNRAGLWSRRDTTPFGYGRPYSLGQIEGQLRRHGLLPGKHVAALFQPPTHRRFWLRAGPALERIGRAVSNYWAGGVLIVEAGKHPPAPVGGARDAVRGPIEALAGMPEPARGRTRAPRGPALPAARACPPGAPWPAPGGPGGSLVGAGGRCYMPPEPIWEDHGG
jgi:SAM-dependent methyltransferase